MSKTLKTPLKRRNVDQADSLSGEKFDALPSSEKERIFQELERETSTERLAKSNPLTAAPRERWSRIKKEIGRPKIGKGIKVISLSVELDLMKRADAYAKSVDLKRSALFAAGLQRVLSGV